MDLIRRRKQPRLPLTPVPYILDDDTGTNATSQQLAFITPHASPLKQLSFEPTATVHMRRSTDLCERIRLHSDASRSQKSPDSISLSRTFTPPLPGPSPSEPVHIPRSPPAVPFSMTTERHSNSGSFLFATALAATSAAVAANCTPVAGPSSNSVDANTDGDISIQSSTQPETSSAVVLSMSFPSTLDCSLSHDGARLYTVTTGAGQSDRSDAPRSNPATRSSSAVGSTRFAWISQSSLVGAGLASSSAAAAASAVHTLVDSSFLSSTSDPKMSASRSLSSLAVSAPNVRTVIQRADGPQSLTHVATIDWGAQSPVGPNHSSLDVAEQTDSASMITQDRDTEAMTSTTESPTAKGGVTLRMANGRVYRVDDFLSTCRFSGTRTLSIPNYLYKLKWKRGQDDWKLVPLKGKLILATITRASLASSACINIYTSALLALHRSRSRAATSNKCARERKDSWPGSGFGGNVKYGYENGFGLSREKEYAGIPVGLLDYLVTSALLVVVLDTHNGALANLNSDGRGSANSLPDGSRRSNRDGSLKMRLGGISISSKLGFGLKKKARTISGANTKSANTGTSVKEKLGIKGKPKEYQDCCMGVAGAIDGWRMGVEAEAEEPESEKLDEPDQLDPSMAHRGEDRTTCHQQSDEKLDDGVVCVGREARPNTLPGVLSRTTSPAPSSSQGVSLGNIPRTSLSSIWASSPESTSVSGSIHLRELRPHPFAMRDAFCQGHSSFERCDSVDINEENAGVEAILADQMSVDISGIDEYSDVGSDPRALSLKSDTRAIAQGTPTSLMETRSLPPPSPAQSSSLLLPHAHAHTLQHSWSLGSSTSSPGVVLGSGLTSIPFPATDARASCSAVTAPATATAGGSGRRPFRPLPRIPTGPRAMPGTETEIPPVPPLPPGVGPSSTPKAQTASIPMVATVTDVVLPSLDLRRNADQLATATISATATSGMGVASIHCNHFIAKISPPPMASANTLTTSIAPVSVAITAPISERAKAEIEGDYGIVPFRVTRYASDSTATDSTTVSSISPIGGCSSRTAHHTRTDPLYRRADVPGSIGGMEGSAQHRRYGFLDTEYVPGHFGAASRGADRMFIPERRRRALSSLYYPPTELPPDGELAGHLAELELDEEDEELVRAADGEERRAGSAIGANVARARSIARLLGVGEDAVDERDAHNSQPPPAYDSIDFSKP